MQTFFLIDTIGLEIHVLSSLINGHYYCVKTLIFIFFLCGRNSKNGILIVELPEIYKLS